jgi:hypothetical protein
MFVLYAYNSKLALQVLFVWLVTVAIIHCDLSPTSSSLTTLPPHLSAYSNHLKVLEFTLHDVDRRGDTRRETTF